MPTGVAVERNLFWKDLHGVVVDLTHTISGKVSRLAVCCEGKVLPCKISPFFFSLFEKNVRQ
jgi:hypothetical protein